MCHSRETKIREYAEGMPVSVSVISTDCNTNPIEPRICIGALNEGGYNGVDVDLQDIIDWVKKNEPEMLKD